MDEKHADIIAEMRECDGFRAYYDGGKYHDSGEQSVVDVDYLHDFASRLEAAHKRELKEAEVNASPLPCVVLKGGNAAAMREALAEARRFVFASAQCSDRDLLVNDGVHAPYVLTPKETLAKIDAALAAPPRQCDMGTVEEQSRRMHAFCDSHGHGFDGQCYSCENCRFLPIYRCELAWAQLPYESEAKP